MTRYERPHRPGLTSGLVSTITRAGSASQPGHAHTRPALTLLDSRRAEHKHRVMPRYHLAAPEHGAD